MGTIIAAREDLRILLASPAGRRFRDRHHRHRQRRQRSSGFTRFLYLLVGVVVAVGSLVLAPLPGPGWATVFLGLGIVAGEHKPSARLLDRFELVLRHVGFRLKSLWLASGTAGRIMMLTAGAAAAVGILAVAVRSVLLLF